MPFKRGGIAPFWEELGVRQCPDYERSWGYKLHHSRPMQYPEDFKAKHKIFIIAHYTQQRPKGKALRGYLKAVETDFGFKGREIDFKQWPFVKVIPGYSKGLRDRMISMSRQCKGCVFIFCGSRNHRLGVFINPEKHLVIYAPYEGNIAFYKSSIFKSTVEYLNVDPNIFRPH